MIKTYYTYVLKCSDSTYYTGVTNNIDLRLKQHQEGIDPKCYTFFRRPVEVVYFSIFNDINQAIAVEKQIKSWSRKKKEALIKGELHLLPELSKRKNPNR